MLNSSTPIEYSSPTDELKNIQNNYVNNESILHHKQQTNVYLK